MVVLRRRLLRPDAAVGVNPATAGVAVPSPAAAATSGGSRVPIEHPCVMLRRGPVPTGRRAG
ncbi:MAG: hypothetical protein AVDCRST_MAG75-2321 [uncultured Propionibacteriaceae bacterium]|uniref:Uncharacterized protein n=1 Tax=uncultured Propionibacteriaceae bacterium TaxID=257457 RepID=A0A6J4P3Q9_9ACTN|nr:MAG: hypothetical protein AVDCRST_MAG75-2321 [uncultured Propionibacteriaceae bacterium]